MPVFRVLMQFSGTATVIVEAEDEDEAARLARKLAELNDTAAIAVEYEVADVATVKP